MRKRTLAEPGVWRWHLNDRRERPAPFGKDSRIVLPAGADDDDKDEHDTQRGCHTIPASTRIDRSLTAFLIVPRQSVGWSVRVGLFHRDAHPDGTMMPDGVG